MSAATWLALRVRTAGQVPPDCFGISLFGTEFRQHEVGSKVAPRQGGKLWWVNSAPICVQFAPVASAAEAGVSVELQAWQPANSLMKSLAWWLDSLDAEQVSRAQLAWLMQQNAIHELRLPPYAQAEELAAALAALNKILQPAYGLECCTLQRVDLAKRAHTRLGSSAICALVAGNSPTVLGAKLPAQGQEIFSETDQHNTKDQGQRIFSEITRYFAKDQCAAGGVLDDPPDYAQEFARNEIFAERRFLHDLPALAKILAHCEVREANMQVRLRDLRHRALHLANTRAGRRPSRTSRPAAPEQMHWLAQSSHHASISLDAMWAILPAQNVHPLGGTLDVAQIEQLEAAMTEMEIQLNRRFNAWWELQP